MAERDRLTVLGASKEGPGLRFEAVTLDGRFASH
jgi:hypothetical protein